MIKFNCKKCGQKLSVPGDRAGKKGKCPKCKNIIVVPEIQHKDSVINQTNSAIPEFEAQNFADNEILLEAIEKDQTQDELPDLSCVLEKATKNEHEPKEEPSNGTELPPERKLPWLLDIFLYPVSRGGLTTLAVIMILRLLTDFLSGFLMCCCYGGIVSIIIRIIVVYSYMYWYFSECISDSAVGGLRAPETFANMPGLGDMIWQWIKLFACYAFTFGPATFYSGYTYFYKIETNRIILWSLLTYGMFFFPMGALAVIMFDSVNGLNPVLLIRSFFSTLVHYCGLVILFYGFSILFYIFRAFMVPVMSQREVISYMFFTYLLFHIFTIYTLLILGHLLGRFYWRHKEELNWEV
jgi:phage FluMu protein Com